jgi:hypothetical protein
MHSIWSGAYMHIICDLVSASQTLHLPKNLLTESEDNLSTRGILESLSIESSASFWWVKKKETLGNGKA